MVLRKSSLDDSVRYSPEKNLMRTGALKYLHTKVIPILSNLFSNPGIPNILHSSYWFILFLNRWLDQRVVLEWPARSPDLIPVFLTSSPEQGQPNSTCKHTTLKN